MDARGVLVLLLWFAFVVAAPFAWLWALLRV